MDRCPWAKGDLYVRYHDVEWGVPVHDDRLLFEFLVLEGAQAGLSWETILKKRENYRNAFDQFDPEGVAGYSRKKLEGLLADNLVRTGGPVSLPRPRSCGDMPTQHPLGNSTGFRGITASLPPSGPA